MRAILCEGFGPPSSLVMRDIEAPQPGPGEAVVEIAATGLNFFDTLIIAGRYQVRPAFPFSPGAEFAGTVSALGEGASGITLGERVVGYSGWGACREQIAVPARQLVPVPAGVDLARAAAMMVTYGTTLHALVDRGRLRDGETLVVLGAAGGTGVAAIEIGKLLGARVVAVASSPDKLAFCRARGADVTIDYARDDLRQQLKALGGAGVDIVYDTVGGAASEAALRSLAPGGRLLVIGFASGEIPAIPLNLPLLKSCDIVGVHWGRLVDADLETHRANTRQLLDWLAEGRISVPIHASYDLADTPAALEAIAGRAVKGKVVVRP